MLLTDAQKRMLDGQQGMAVRKAMELLVAVGDCFDAQEMVPISSAHLVSATPTTAGKAGVKFILGMKEMGGRFVVPVTTNPNCVEPFEWERMDFPKDLRDASKALSQSLAEMGAFNTQTCTPYLIGHAPAYRQHLAWGESSAIVYANSRIGSRTNREGGPTALASAITGLTPNYGLHLPANRIPTLQIRIDIPLRDEYEYALAGYYTGRISEDRVPLITGMPANVSLDELKCFGAAAAVSGSVALFHAQGVTPEAIANEEIVKARITDSDTYRFGTEELKAMQELVGAEAIRQANLVILGCPHASIAQLRNWAMQVEGKKVKSSIEFWILSSNVVKSYARDLGYLDIFERAGIRLVANTCPASMPRDHFKSKGFHWVVTNSPKLRYYASTRQGIQAYCSSLEAILGHCLTTR